MPIQNTDHLEWLDTWYQEQCNGEWEHSQGVHLSTLKESGWQLTINLTGTSAEHTPPQKLAFDSPAGDWITCTLAGGRFEGSGDPRRLEQIIGIFRRWVDAPAASRS
jgi:hypothetical protein